MLSRYAVAGGIHDIIAIHSLVSINMLQCRCLRNGDGRQEKAFDAEERCRDPGSNQGPSDLQSDALPTELPRPHTAQSTHTIQHMHYQRTSRVTHVFTYGSLHPACNRRSMARTCSICENTESDNEGDRPSGDTTYGTDTAMRRLKPMRSALTDTKISDCRHR